jgi:hypothetical protein
LEESLVTERTAIALIALEFLGRYDPLRGRSFAARPVLTDILLDGVSIRELVKQQAK